MITIIHGENTVASRQYLADVLKKFKSLGYGVIRPEGTRDLENFTDFSQSVTLFGQKTVVVLENFLKQKGKIKPSVNRDELNEVVFWEDGKRSAAVLAQFDKRAQVMEFKVPYSVFRLLDNLRPDNQKTTIRLYHQLLKNLPPEMIFSFVASRFIDLYYPPIGKPDWTKEKLSTQTQSFTKIKLAGILRELSAIDLGQKNSLSPLPLDKQLEVFLLKL
jgi:hypothetical protein